MNKQIRVFAWCALTMLLAAAIFSYKIYTNSMNGELGNKKDYSILQSVESEHRKDADRTSIITINNINQTGRDVAGFPIEDNQATRVWIILNKTGGDGTIFAVPDNLKNKILCRDINTLSDKNQDSRKILEYLHLHCLE